MTLVDAGLFSRVRHMIPELLKFGLIGGIGSVIDLGGAALLHSLYRVGPLESKALSVTAATAFTYLGSRFWTFKDRENQTVGREAVLFVVLNVIGLLIAEAVLGLATYLMGLRGQLEYNMASMLGTGLGTIFRFYAYRKWVFLAPAAQPSASVAGAQPGVPSVHPSWEFGQRHLSPVAAHSVWEPATERPAWAPTAERSAWAPAPEYGQPSWAPAPEYGQPSWAPAPEYGQPSWAPAPEYGQPSWAPAPEYGQSWTPAPEYGQPWQGSADIPNGHVAPPLLTTTARAGHEGYDPERPVSPRPSAQRPGGRHRRH